MHTLAQALGEAGCQGLSASNLKNFRQLALAYPGLDANNLGHRLGLPIEGDHVTGIRQTSGEFALDPENCQTPADSVCSPFPSLARRAAEQDLPWRDAPWLVRLFTTLTFSHLLELSRIDDLTRRAFYELHCLKERWSVRELQRQRDSLLYERIGLSDKRDEVLKLARAGALAESPAAQLRDPYVFEFLGIERRGVMAESDLEGALVDHLQQFLFELGRDFCFVARQFRISSGNRHHYIDLLLFHRRLRCLVAIDLKMGAFQPEHAGQLRFYVNHLAEHVAYPEENPPVGILLCAERDAEVVRFATAGDGDVFVTRYQLGLPTEDQLKAWLHEERARLERTGVGTQERN
jgi:predicted nuclease of restriction endonuclease-like (RecB) superfamily